MSERSKGTPGPWKITTDGMWVGTGEKPICELASRDERHANARIIATAPQGVELARLVIAQYSNIAELLTVVPSAKHDDRDYIAGCDCERCKVRVKWCEMVDKARAILALVEGDK